MLRAGKRERRGSKKRCGIRRLTVSRFYNRAILSSQSYTPASVSTESLPKLSVTEVNLNMSLTLFIFIFRRRLEKRKFSNLPYNTSEDKKVNIVFTICCERTTNKNKFIFKRLTFSANLFNFRGFKCLSNCPFLFP